MPPITPKSPSGYNPLGPWRLVTTFCCPTLRQNIVHTNRSQVLLLWPRGAALLFLTRMCEYKIEGNGSFLKLFEILIQCIELAGLGVYNTDYGEL